MQVSSLVICFCLCTWLSHSSGEVTPDIIANKYRLSEVCDNLNKCQSRQFPDTLELYNCHCGSFCSQFDTCCLDSPFLVSGDERTRQRPVCRKVGGKFASSYFMIDKCPSDGNWNNIYQSLCEDESIENKKLKLVIPVTSLSTNMTYKNYFCFRCHEESTEYMFWNAEVREVGKSNRYHAKDVPFKLRNVNKTWMAPLGNGGKPVPVVFTVDIPSEIRNKPKVCFPDMISSCSEEWPEDEVRKQCDMYMSATYIIQQNKIVWYRNAHCALCNFEDLKYAKCTRGAHQEYTFPVNSWHRLRRSVPKPFSFSLTLEPERKLKANQRCENNYVWDPFYKKCRELKCILPGYVIKEGKCVPP